MDKPPDKLPRREREILDALFAAGEHVSVEQIRDRLTDPPSYSAVRAMLAKLEAKGYVRHREEGPRYVYTPAIPRAAARRAALQQIVRVFFGGSAREMAMALLREERLTAEELDQLSAEIKQARKGDKQK